MNIKRITFWASFIIILGLIVWGMIVAMNKPTNQLPTVGEYLAPAPISASDNVKGPSNAPITLIEYSDFQCPACQTYYYFIKRLLEESTTTIKFAYRHYPLPQHSNAMSSALATEAAGLQGKFWEMYDLVFPKHSEWETKSEPTNVFVGYATQIGLDVSKFRSDLNNSELKEKITSQLREGQSIGVNATPSFFVNGKFINNSQSYAQFKESVYNAAGIGAN